MGCTLIYRTEYRENDEGTLHPTEASYQTAAFSTENRHFPGETLHYFSIFNRKPCRSQDLSQRRIPPCTFKNIILKKTFKTIIISLAQHLHSEQEVIISGIKFSEEIIIAAGHRRSEDNAEDTCMNVLLKRMTGCF